MDSFLIQHISALGYFGYLFIFIGLLIEGHAFVFLAYFLTGQGVFNFWCISLIVISGVFTEDLFFFWLGAHLKKKSTKFNEWAEKLAKPFDNHLIKRPVRTIFVSKFIYGINRAILVRAGSLGIDFKKLLKGNFPASFIMVSILGTLGYFSKVSFQLVKHYLKIGEFTIFIFLGLLFLADHFISKYFKKSL